MSEHCMQCGRELTHDEIAIYKRMVNRGALPNVRKSARMKNCISPAGAGKFLLKDFKENRHEPR